MDTGGPKVHCKHAGCGKPFANDNSLNTHRSRAHKGALAQVQQPAMLAIAPRSTGQKRAGHLLVDGGSGASGPGQPHKRSKGKASGMDSDTNAAGTIRKLRADVKALEAQLLAANQREADLSSEREAHEAVLKKQADGTLCDAVAALSQAAADQAVEQAADLSKCRTQLAASRDCHLRAMDAETAQRVQIQTLKNQVATLTECSICLERTRCVVLQPCSHIPYCVKCYASQSKSASQGLMCPLCKQVAHGANRVII